MTFDLANFDDLDLDTIESMSKGAATLPIDTAVEWRKGYELTSKLLNMLVKDIHVTEYTDDYGNKRRKTEIPSELMRFLKERRLQIKQIFKIAGGEALNEAKKEKAKQMVQAIWENPDKDKYEQDAINIIEVDELED